jgi:hypothetical protein
MWEQGLKVIGGGAAGRVERILGVEITCGGEMVMSFVSSKAGY